MLSDYLLEELQRYNAEYDENLTIEEYLAAYYPREDKEKEVVPKLTRRNKKKEVKGQLSIYDFIEK